ncbi:hypothetical protein ABH961_005721 [Bacillus sp. RC251]
MDGRISLIAEFGFTNSIRYVKFKKTDYKINA